MSRFNQFHRLLVVLAYLGLCIGLPMSLGQGCPPATTPPPNNPPPDDDPPDNDPPDNDPPDNDLPALGVDIDIPNEGQAHVPPGQQATYQSNPPASGSHWGSFDPPAPAPPGFYDTALEEEQWIHNLEHGYVVILYDCKGPCSPALIADLEALIDAVPQSKHGTDKLVITPYSGLPYLITAVGWDVQLHLDAFDEQVLIDFYNRYIDQGPEDIP